MKKNKTIFIGGLTEQVTTKDLDAHFRTFGKIKNIIFKNTNVPDEKKAFAYLVFQAKESAQKALELDKHIIMGKRIDCQPAHGGKNKKQDVNLMVETKIHLKGLSVKVTSEDLKEYFMPYGEVRQAYIVTDSGKRTKCFGFVQFYNPEITKLVLEESHYLYGKKIKCEKFMPREKNTTNPLFFQAKSNSKSYEFDTSNEYQNFPDFNKQEHDYSNNSSDRSSIEAENNYHEDNNSSKSKPDVSCQVKDSEKAVDRIISKLFDGHDNDARCIYDDSRTSSSYNPFKSPFGYNNSANKIAKNNQVQQDKSIGYIGQHLQDRRNDLDDAKCIYSCHTCKNKEVQKLLKLFIQNSGFEFNDQRENGIFNNSSDGSNSFSESIKEAEVDISTFDKFSESQLYTHSLRNNLYGIVNSSCD